MRPVDTANATEGVPRVANPPEPAVAGDGMMRNRLPETADPDGDPIAAMSADQRAVMTLLRGRIGGATVECIGEATGLSRSHTERWLEDLRKRGLVRCEERCVLWGYGTVPARLWFLSLTDRCLDLLEHLPLPTPETPTPVERVPPQFWSLFSSGTHPAELRLPEDADAAAGRMLDSADTAARAWALTNLPISALRTLRAMRGYDTGPNAVSLDIAIAHRPDA